MRPARNIRMSLLILLCSQFHSSFSQNCDPYFFAVSYQGNAACFIIKSISTPESNIISVGQVLQINGGLSYDAWISKITNHGTFLWAKRHMLPGYNSGTFSSIAMATDSSYFVTGRFAFLKKRVTDNVLEELYASTVILHLDRYGNLIWTKVLNMFITYFAAIDEVLKTTDGDFVLHISISSMNSSRSLFCKMDVNGNIKWCRQVYADNYLLNFSVATQASNGDIIFGGTAYKNNFSESGFLLTGFSLQSGEPTFSHAYIISTSGNGGPYGVQCITQWANGDFSIGASFSDSGRLIVPPYSLKAANLITDIEGNFKKAYAYYNNKPGCKLADASDPDANGNQLLLMDDGQKPLLAKTNIDGQLLWQKCYGGINQLLEPCRIVAGNRILFKGRRQVALMGLAKTGDDGEMICMETPVNILMQNATATFKQENLSLNVQPINQPIFVDAGGGISHFNYEFQSTIDCKVSCCTNSIRQNPKLELCNVPFYTLPNNYKVKESGIYDITFHTPQGCDSTVFYDISLLKKPAITLGEDECMDGKDSVVLKAKGGYSKYTWMNTSSPDSNYVVYQPGNYWVQVTNICGSAIDSVRVFEKCDFPVYIPSGFTPNGDGLNDIFRVPDQNKNKLITLKIFNRWGQLVFETNTDNKGWDGKYKNQPQPPGTYVYFIEMKNLAGRSVSSRGLVTLIR